jgi:hypothetical protein
LKKRRKPFLTLVALTLLAARLNKKNPPKFFLTEREVETLLFSPLGNKEERYVKEKQAHNAKDKETQEDDVATATDVQA